MGIRHVVGKTWTMQIMTRIEILAVNQTCDDVPTTENSRIKSMDQNILSFNIMIQQLVPQEL